LKAENFLIGFGGALRAPHFSLGSLMVVDFEFVTLQAAELSRYQLA
jgi:hypothetical protein